MLPFLLCALAAAPTPPALSDDDEVVHELFEGLPERWERAVTELSIPGMSVVAVMDDEIALLKCFGLRDVEKDLPVTPDTAFYIASATKPFVAMAVAALADEGRLDLDAPVKRYLPRFELAAEEATETITVRDLLCHSQGLNYGPIVLLDAYTGEITEDRYYHFLRRVEPLGRTAYSNVHFTLAGRIVEAVSGRPWRDELAVRIFEPTGMTRTTGYADEMYARADVAIPTVWDGGGHLPAPVRKTDRTMHAAGGLGTSARDVAQWLRLNLGKGKVNGHRVLSAQRCEQMQTRQSEAQRGSEVFQDQGFGLGWQVSSFEGVKVLKHGGGYVGSSSLITFVPEVGVGVGVLINTDVAGAQLCELVTADVLDRLMVVDRRDLLPTLIQQLKASRSRSSAPPPVQNPAPDGLSLAPQAYVGTYSDEHLGTFRIALEDGELRAWLGDMALVIARVRTDVFGITSGGLDTEGRFEVANDEVAAVVMVVGGEEYRFER